jgi:hypothetical protein
MTEPAKSVREIEDVLASIRRLVSDSDAAPPAARASVAARHVVQDATGPASRLVLTPEFRVTEPDDPWTPVPVTRQEAAPQDRLILGKDEGSIWDPEDRLLDWSEIEDSATQVVFENLAEPDRGPVPAAEPKGDALADLTRLDGSVDMAIAEFEPETGDADWPDGSAGSALRELLLARGGVTANPAARQADAAIHATEAEAGPDTVAAPATEPCRDAQRQSGEMSGEALGSQTAEHGVWAEGTWRGPAITPVFSRRPEVHRGSAADDDIHVETDRSTSEDVERSEMQGPFSPETDARAPLDEGRLRAIIAEVVREELQGATGQRIKRYVDTAVRREVRLALGTDKPD